MVNEPIALSPITQQLLMDCRKAAATRSKVLITGESGVGKEAFARFIHSQSPRSERPLVAINCAGVPETLLESELFGHVRGSFTDAHRDRRGLLELAHGGTILLDEIGEMSLRMQTLLLRFLETGEIQPVGSEKAQRVVDVRLIAATNRDLLEETKKGTIREDLYYRLHVVHLEVPPLRERREDIRPLLDLYLRRACEDEGRPAPLLTPDAYTFLEAYRWPGNVRELKNIVERLMVDYSGRWVDVDALPAELREVDPPAAARSDRYLPVSDECYQRMLSGKESFWTVVYEPFMARDITREDLRAILTRALLQTRGSYPLVAELFNVPVSEHRRFMRFLHQHGCHMPVERFRGLTTMVPANATQRSPNTEATA